MVVVGALLLAVKGFIVLPVAVFIKVAVVDVAIFINPLAFVVVVSNNDFLIIVIKTQRHTKSAHGSAHAKHAVKTASLELVDKSVCALGVCLDLLVAFVGFCRFFCLAVGFCRLFHFVRGFCLFVRFFVGFCPVLLILCGNVELHASAKSTKAHSSAKSVVKASAHILAHKLAFCGGVCGDFLLGFVGFCRFFCLAVGFCRCGLVILLFGVKGCPRCKHALNVPFKHASAGFLYQTFLLIFLLGQALLLTLQCVALRSLKGCSPCCLLLLLKSHLVG